ncbi:MAG: amidase domain-containing protein [Clostridia bacterium]|nr:amidase domain-containing protein [Clostridia bacterium]
MGKTPIILPYNREKAIEYAHKWAFGRNPAYLNFDKFGGDCTNFASQVIFAGSGIMNYTSIFGWYYVNSYDRSPSWTGVNYLHEFLMNNKGQGPFAQRVDFKDVMPGDIVQLSFEGGSRFNHTPVIVKVDSPVTLDKIFISAHTYDRDNYPLTNYNWKDIRFLHIEGIRKY